MDGFVIKGEITVFLREAGHEVRDFGSYPLTLEDDSPEYIVPLGLKVAKGVFEWDVAFCGSGVIASIVANKVSGVQAGLIHDSFSAHQGVEDIEMNVHCLSSYVIGVELVNIFLNASFSGYERGRRRLNKVTALERDNLV
jgi:ribose 5-phosphate isomerase B